jgi:hypothetical protein
LIKKETKKSRTKDVHPLRPTAMTDGGATVHQHLYFATACFFAIACYNRKRNIAINNTASNLKIELLMLSLQ